jgi:hypothetical protein
VRCSSLTGSRSAVKTTSMASETMLIERRQKKFFSDFVPECKFSLVVMLRDIRLLGEIAYVALLQSHHIEDVARNSSVI